MEIKMKRVFLSLITVFLIGGIIVAQDGGAPDVSLDSFEQCNNWARHYCLNGNHNNAVNYKLLQLKKRGYIITTKLIKSYAQRTPANTQVPQNAN